MFSEQQLKKFKNAELSALLKERNLPVSGTKPVLIARLLGQPIPAAAPKSKAKKAIVAPRPDPPCFNLLSKLYVHATKNAFGNYEDPTSHLVFDPDTKKVIGRQVDADVVKLTIDDVRVCRERGLSFDPHVFNGNFATASKDQDIEATIERLLREEGESESESEEADEEN